MSENAQILYCRCAYAQVVPNGIKNAVLEQLSACGKSFEAVSDLCEFAAHRDPRLTELSQKASTGGLQIIACYPRVVRGLFKQAGSDLPDSGITFLNMRTQSADEITQALLAPPSPETPATDAQ
jgi:hypothetical protein